MSEELRKKYLQMPQDLKDALFSEEVAITIQAIAKKHNLLIDKMSALADEIGNIILGASHPKDFIRILSSKLGVDNETARKIADDVNQQIFAKVRESLRKLHGITNEEDMTPKDSLPPAMKEIPIAIKKPEPLEIRPAGSVTELSLPPPAPNPPAGLAFKEKIEPAVSHQPPELRKIERPTIDPYREPME